MTILLLGDLTGRSRVALRMLTFELEKRGHEVLMLPTALISNTLNLGRAAMLDTTGDLMESLETWKSLGLSYDLVIYRLCDRPFARKGKAMPGCGRCAAHGVPSWWTRFLGDNGRRYNSVTTEQVEAMKRLIGHADVMTPNLTEACLLADALRACRLAKTDRSTLE